MMLSRRMVLVKTMVMTRLGADEEDGDDAGEDDEQARWRLVRAWGNLIRANSWSASRQEQLAQKGKKEKVSETSFYIFRKQIMF